MPVALLARYRAVFARRALRPVLAALFLCYLASGMVSIALMLAVEHVTGSYATAGAASALHAVLLAVAAPVWGRAVDVWGATRSLVVAGAAHAGACALLAVAVGTGAWNGLLLVAAALVGATTPPASSVGKRAFLAVRDENGRRSLLALTGLFAEVVFVVGPLIVGLVVAVSAPPYGMVAVAATAAAGACWLACSVDGRPTDSGTRAGRRAGVARSRAQLHVMAVTVLGAFTIGAVQVSTLAHADDLGVSGALLVTVLAAGGVVASLLYGGLHLPGPPGRHLAVCLGTYGVLVLVMGSTPAVLGSVVLLVLVGAATGPSDALESLLLAERTRAARQTQAFSVLVTANWVGFAAGSAVAGAVVDAPIDGVGFIVGGLVALVAAAFLCVAGITRSHPAQNDGASPAGGGR